MKLHHFPFCSCSMVLGAIVLAGVFSPAVFAQTEKGAGRNGKGGAAKPPGARPRDQAPSWLMPEVKGENLHYRTFDVKGRTTIRIVTRTTGLSGANEKFHELLGRLGLEHEFYKIPDAPHSPNPIYEGLGERNWPFYAKAFQDAQPAK